jgi:hypothetical protein
MDDREGERKEVLVERKGMEDDEEGMYEVGSRRRAVVADEGV